MDPLRSAPRPHSGAERGKTKLERMERKGEKLKERGNMAGSEKGGEKMTGCGAWKKVVLRLSERGHGGWLSPECNYVHQRRCGLKSRKGGVLTDSCQFLTDEIMGVQNFHFPLTSPETGIFSRKFGNLGKMFRRRKFSDRLKFRGGLRLPLPSGPLPRDDQTFAASYLTSGDDLTTRWGTKTPKYLCV